MIRQETIIGALADLDRSLDPAQLAVTLFINGRSVTAQELEQFVGYIKTTLHAARQKLQTLLQFTDQSQNHYRNVSKMLRGDAMHPNIMRVITTAQLVIIHPKDCTNQQKLEQRLGPVRQAIKQSLRRLRQLERVAKERSYTDIAVLLAETFRYQYGQEE